MEFRHDNIHFTLPNGNIFSIVRINNNHEVAVLDEHDFVPLSEWYGKDSMWSDDEVVLRINAQASTLRDILGTAVAWSDREKNRLMAEALDQAL